MELPANLERKNALIHEKDEPTRPHKSGKLSFNYVWRCSWDMSKVVENSVFSFIWKFCYLDEKTSTFSDETYGTTQTFLGAGSGDVAETFLNNFTEDWEKGTTETYAAKFLVSFSEKGLLGWCMEILMHDVVEYFY